MIMTPTNAGIRYADFTRGAAELQRYCDCATPAVRACTRAERAVHWFPSTAFCLFCCVHSAHMEAWTLLMRRRGRGNKWGQASLDNPHGPYTAHTRSTRT